MKPASTSLDTAPTIWVDVEDLYDYSRHSVRPSGIQRLAFELQRELHRRLGHTGRLRFVRHGQHKNGPPLREVQWTDVEALFSQLTRPSDHNSTMAGTIVRTSEELRLLAARRRAGRIAFQMPAELRDPLSRSWSLQKSAALEFAELFRTSRERPKMRNSSPSLEPGAPIKNGDVFLVLGSPWVHADFGGRVKELRDRYGLQVALLLYDLIPALRPEWCARDLVDRFRVWLDATLPLCSVLFSISRYTAMEVERWASRTGIRLAGPVRPVPIGASFGLGSDLWQCRPPDPPVAGRYVLFVSTLEARKNHALLLRVWRRLLDEEQAKLRPSGSVPDLVFAGRVGWLVSDLMQQLENSSWLDGRVRLVRDPSDAELRAMYEGCLFTLFPSLHEGWGLPVSEALSLGVPVLCSSATALLEAGGNLARYFDPDDTGSCHRAVAALLDDPKGLAAWRNEVRTRYQPTPWSATAQAILRALPGNWVEMASDAAQ
jgi:glycosyltransferase involved in cell wall biosynthesis